MGVARHNKRAHHFRPFPYRVRKFLVPVFLIVAHRHVDKRLQLHAEPLTVETLAITPSSSRSRIRRRQAEGDSEIRSAKSRLLMRPSSCSTDKIRQSVASS